MDVRARVRTCARTYARAEISRRRSASHLKIVHRKFGRFKIQKGKVQINKFGQVKEIDSSISNTKADVECEGGGEENDVKSPICKFF